MKPTTLVRLHPVSAGGSGSVLAEYEAGRDKDAAGVVMNLAGAIGSGVGGPTVSRSAQMPVVDDVPLAPKDDVQEGGDEPPELDVVTAGEDVTL